ncbi:hypothetical protein GQ42DRAFT_21011, partial [Ramicandelaber brevisporus]
VHFFDRADKNGWQLFSTLPAVKQDVGFTKQLRISMATAVSAPPSPDQVAELAPHLADLDLTWHATPVTCPPPISIAGNSSGIAPQAFAAVYPQLRSLSVHLCCHTAVAVVGNGTHARLTPARFPALEKLRLRRISGECANRRNTQLLRSAIRDIFSAKWNHLREVELQCTLAASDLLTVAANLPAIEVLEFEGILPSKPNSNSSSSSDCSCSQAPILKRLSKSRRNSIV